MDELREYRGKRDPARTPEPFAGTSRPAEHDLVFVVQRHAARRLHYDLRLRRGDVLASWALPRGLPVSPGERRLAVRTEDHPLQYADFEGRIPNGEYGAGVMEIWDRGVYELLEEKRDGGLTVRLAGRRLDGVWTLVPARLDGDPRNWLCLRKSGGPSQPPAREHEPMLATLTERLPSGEGWLFEVKWDGFRVLARLTGGAVRLRSRQGNDLTERFAEIARGLPAVVRTPDCVLDGEVVAFDPAGRPSFGALQGGATTLVYYVFDLLELDGVQLVDRPLAERRAALEATIDPGSPLVRLSEATEDGETLLAFARDQHLEGVVAKRASSPYRFASRTRDWLKVKTHERQEFVIAGYTRGAGRRAGGIGALVLAVHDDGGLRWTGNCGTGFTDAELIRLERLLRPLEQDASPLAEVPRMPRVRRQDVVWVSPRLVCEIEFAEWTREGRLRAPSYRGVREDREASSVVRERAPAASGERTLRRGRRELRLTNLDKVFWPDDGITKGDLLDYYERIAPAVVPHLRDRLFTMKRYPDGIAGGHFFQKDAPKHMPDWIPTRRVETVSRGSGRERTIDYPLVNDELALLWMANMGCIDLNATFSRVDRPARPDYVLFDLDPTPEAGFRGCVAVARLVGRALDTLGLAGYPKTSGSDGIHVLVPIVRRHTFEDTRLLAATVAGGLARAYPDLVTTEFLKRKRRGVLIDANQNGEGRTIASVYSVRPHPGAPVSTPLAWDELTDELDPRQFTLEVVLRRVERLGDLFAPVLGGGQSITTALRSLV